MSSKQTLPVKGYQKASSKSRKNKILAAAIEVDQAYVCIEPD
jgi:hypothetical protein